VFVKYYPRLVILLVAVLNLTVIVCGFSIYHLMLAVTNQTVNERYKYYHLSQSTTVAATLNSNWYHRGILSNLWEEFFPLQHARFCSSRKI